MAYQTEVNGAGYDRAGMELCWLVPRWQQYRQSQGARGIQLPTGKLKPVLGIFHIGAELIRLQGWNWMPSDLQRSSQSIATGDEPDFYTIDLLVVYGYLYRLTVCGIPPLPVNQRRTAGTIVMATERVARRWWSDGRDNTATGVEW